MKLFELLSGLRKPVESREFQIDDDPKTYKFSELQNMGLSKNQIEHLRFIKPTEHRTMNDMIIRRVDKE